MLRKELEEIFAKAEDGEAFFWRSHPGLPEIVEVAWLPFAKKWVYHKTEDGTIGQADRLTIVLSLTNGEKEPLDNVPNLIFVDGDYGPESSMWVLNGPVPSGVETPADAKVFHVSEPWEGLVEDAATADQTKEAFETLKKAMEGDPGYALSWHCNIVWAAFDEGVTSDVANRVANRFMKNCFGIETKEPSTKEQL